MFHQLTPKSDMLDNQQVIWPIVRAKESESFMTGKSEFHGRKVRVCLNVRGMRDICCLLYTGIVKLFHFFHCLKMVLRVTV